MLPVKVPVKVFGAGLGNQAQRAAALAALGRIVKRSGDFHFLQGVGVRQGHRVKVSEVEIVDVDAVKRNAVVAGALSVNTHVCGSASSGAHVGRLAGNPGGKREQEQEVG